jgi:basic membrane lipoprotein Med (substrate-binding protein (PBP1-ABC) superfamily)
MSEFFDQAKKLASEHSDIADKGFDAAANEAKERTDNKYDNQVDQGEEKLEGFLGMDVQDGNNNQ